MRKVENLLVVPPRHRCMLYPPTDPEKPLENRESLTHCASRTSYVVASNTYFYYLNLGCGKELVYGLDGCPPL